MLRLGVIALLLLALAAAAEPFDRRYMMAAATGVVRIESGKGGPRYTVGTGTVSGPQEVVTAHHVVRDATHVYVISGGLRHRAAVRRIDPARDICVLSVPNLDARPLAARPAGQLQIGEPVAAIGYSGGGGLGFTTGEVTHLHRFSGGDVIESTAAFTSGASGGPLLDSQGRLVGLLLFRGLNGAGHFYAGPVEWLRTDPAADRRETPPFWQETEARLPYFMRATLLQGESRWDDLQTLAGRWSRDEPNNAEPLYVLGQIQVRVGKTEDASWSYLQAIARDPRHALSWYGLTRAMLELERTGCARIAYARLAELSPALSRRAAEAYPELGGSMEAATCASF
jgi:hypothetical protein